MPEEVVNNAQVTTNTEATNAQTGSAEQAKTEASDQKPINDGLKTELGKAFEEKEEKQEGEDKPEGEGEKPVVPEKYEFQTPEGFEKLDTELLAKVEPFFKSKGFTQEQAQELVNAYAEHQKAQIAIRQKENEDARSAWKTQIKSDNEMGGSDEAYNKTRELAGRGLAAYANKDFINFLEVSGLGDHPEMVRFAAKVGKTISEGSFVQGGQVNTKQAPKYTTNEFLGGPEIHQPQTT